MMGDCGYPNEWFVEPIDEYLQCGICGQVLKDPRATQCGHVFCNHCLSTWIHAYGICPNRCGEVEVDNTRRALHIEKRISGLFIVCSNQHLGCAVQVQLIDKERHEKSCPYRQQQQSSNESSNKLHKQTLTSTLSQQDLSSRSEKKHYRVHHKRARSFGSTHHTTTIIATPRRSATNRSPRIRHPIKDSHGMQATTHTFRLKRTRTKEPLGLVLVSGEKTPDGRPMSFYVKDVNSDTLGWKAGFKAGDRIVQVDFYDLARMNPQEAVARIKEKTLVTLTVLRGLEPLHSTDTPGVEEHIYDEILYNDFQQSQGLSQQDENTLPVGLLKSNRKKQHKSEESHRKRPTSPAANFFHKMRGGHETHTPQQGGEKGSKDSGLSSGSSGSPHRPMNTLLEAKNIDPAEMERGVDVRHSYRTQREMVKKFSKDQKGNSEIIASQREDSRRRNCRIEGEYEVEEIYLEKNGTSQLGVTLGYDTKTAKGGHLYVCEVLSTGLAAQDGRLRCGDIIRRVNGFEVYDPEDAVLFFLEQDQDITLTVARKIKPVSNRLFGSSTSQPEQDHTYAVLEPAVLNDPSSKLRRIDSCGSLDSHSHKYISNDRRDHHHHNQHVRGPVEESTMMTKDDDGYERVTDGRQRRSSSPVIHHTRIRRKSPSQSPPRNPSSLTTDSFTQPPTTTHHQKIQQSQDEFTFRPISVNEQRVRPNTVSIEQQTSKTSNTRRIVRPSSTTPDNRHRINYEPKIMSPAYAPKKPASFRMLANEIHKLPSRCDNMDYFNNRSESLV